MTKHCKICDSVELSTLYQIESLPLFQNKVYETQTIAVEQKTVPVLLCQCQECGFVFNSVFDNSHMDYDDNYQNEQNYSGTFVQHLHDVAAFLTTQGLKEKNIVEIGCGKGYFVELLEKNGFQNVTGFDPAYEGNNPKIIKDYFGPKYLSLDADLIIMRHVLEHIEHPFDFLSHIKNACSEKTKILIEVPDFQWIVDNKAFWDIYYEHCNYFDRDFLKSFFKNTVLKNMFDGQYLLALADINTLQKPYSAHHYAPNLFDSTSNAIAAFLQTHQKNIIWGASSKGVTMLNLLDKDKKYVEYCIDINPKKQNKFIAATGHKIFSPEILKGEEEEMNVIVANQNYFEEITGMYKDRDNLKFYTIEGIVQ
ncbi:MAG: class I SAM-dependent methyltransferase [Sulfuricurvum sp.]|nr:class I SAM-dependent methyltransferase [Sulfuricurvum sp.]